MSQAKYPRWLRSNNPDLNEPREHPKQGVGLYIGLLPESCLHDVVRLR